MQKIKPNSKNYLRTDSVTHLYFRAMSPDAQRVAIRRLALAGVKEEVIAARTEWPIDKVREVIHSDLPKNLLHRQNRFEMRQHHTYRKAATSTDRKFLEINNYS